MRLYQNFEVILRMGSFPNKATQFPVNRQDHTQKGPYLTPLLKRLLEKKIRYIDPETNKTVKGKVKHAIMLRYILNASEGDNQAIEGILDRVDGKVAQKLEGELKGSGPIVVAIPVERQQEYADRLNGTKKG